MHCLLNPCASQHLTPVCLQARASVLTAAQCASYDESKKLWMKLTGGGEDFTTHLGASMITGVVTTTATGPVDVIKTNMFVGEPLCQMNQRACQIDQKAWLSTRANKAECHAIMVVDALLAFRSCTWQAVQLCLQRASLGKNTWDCLVCITFNVYTAHDADLHAGAGGNRYSGPMQCAKDIIKQEGVRGLFRGWTANYARLGPQTTVIFVVMEQIRSMSGLGAL